MIEFRTGTWLAADFAIGVLLIGLLYSGLNALVALAWKLICLVAKGAGTLAGRRLSPPAAARALAPYRFLSRIRGQSVGAILAPLAIMCMEQG